MIKTLKLFHGIKRFYKIFGVEIDSNPNPIKLRDLRSHDFLLGVKLDIYEVLEATAYNFTEADYQLNAWLTKLITHINNIIL